MPDTRDAQIKYCRAAALPGSISRGRWRTGLRELERVPRSPGGESGAEARARNEVQARLFRLGGLGQPEWEMYVLADNGAYGLSAGHLPNPVVVVVGNPHQWSREMTEDEQNQLQESHTGHIIALSRIVTLLLGTHPNGKEILRELTSEDAAPQHPGIRQGYMDLLEQITASLKSGVH